jgi:translation initiation factor 1
MDNLSFDPMAELNNSFLPEKKKEEVVVHIRIQQRNGRKSITIIENLDKYNDGELNITNISKFLRKKFKCSSSIHKTKDEDDVVIQETIQMSGDNREEIKKFLINGNICDEKYIKIHGF